MTVRERAPDRRRRLAGALHLAAQLPGSRWFMRLHAFVLYRTRGRLLANWSGGRVLVLEVMGRSTGRLRRATVAYAPHPTGWIVCSANGGLDRLPQWSANLRAAGAGVVYAGGRRHEVTAIAPIGDSASVLWDLYLQRQPVVDHYRAMTARTFDLFLLQRR